MMEQLVPLIEVHCYIGEDKMGRWFVAGKQGNGVSIVLKGIASHSNILYIGEENLITGIL